MLEANKKMDEPLTVAEQITDEMIAVRAYERWQHRGCPLGEHEQDWFASRTELEQEIRLRMQRLRMKAQ